MGLGGAKRSRSPSDASPVAFCLLCRHGQSRSPPAGGEIPSAGNGRIRTLPPHPPPSGAPDPIPSGLRPSPLDKGSRPPGGRLSGGPVCRPYGEREDFRAVRTPPLRKKRRLWGAPVGGCGVPKWAGFPTPPAGCAPLAHNFFKKGHPGPPGALEAGGLSKNGNFFRNFTEIFRRNPPL